MQGAFRVAAEHLERGEVVRGAGLHQRVAERPRQPERVRETGGGLGHGAALERDRAEQVGGTEGAVPVAAGLEPRERVPRQGRRLIEATLPGGGRGGAEVGVGRARHRQ